jgi:hypothetical protein
VNLAGKGFNFFSPLESFSGQKKRQNLADRSGPVGRNDVTPGRQKKGRKKN